MALKVNAENAADVLRYSAPSWSDRINYFVSKLKPKSPWIVSTKVHEHNPDGQCVFLPLTFHIKDIVVLAGTMDGRDCVVVFHNTVNLRVCKPLQEMITLYNLYHKIKK